jgi:hypothetical protein
MTEQEKVNIEDRLRKLESHLSSIDRTHRNNRRTVKGVLYATGIMLICILIAWIIWMVYGLPPE